jgi:hypothetical protein
MRRSDMLSPPARSAANGGPSPGTANCATRPSPVPETTTPLRSVSVTARGGTIDPLVVAVAVCALRVAVAPADVAPVAVPLVAALRCVSDSVSALRVAVRADNDFDAVAAPDVAPVALALVAAVPGDTDSVDGCVPPLRVPPPPPVVRPVRVSVAVAPVGDTDDVAVPPDADGPESDAVSPESD